MSVVEIGCCGAYCGTCRAFVPGGCAGCKIGYENGERDFARAKCKIKVCCLALKHGSCADCSELDTCSTINGFYDKQGYKYGKYRQAIQFIRENGYERFLEVAGKWKNAYGKY